MVPNSRIALDLEMCGIGCIYFPTCAALKYVRTTFLSFIFSHWAHSRHESKYFFITFSTQVQVNEWHFKDRLTHCGFIINSRFPSRPPRAIPQLYKWAVN